VLVETKKRNADGGKKDGNLKNQKGHSQGPSDQKRVGMVHEILLKLVKLGLKNSKTNRAVEVFRPGDRLQKIPGVEGTRS